MKKDIDVNDCESPPPPTPPTPKKRNKAKLRHQLNFQNGRNKLPVFMQNNLLRSIFVMKEENKKKKRGRRDFVDPYKEILSIKYI